MTPQLLEDIAQETKKGQHKLHVINYLLAHQTATMTDIAKELYVSIPTAAKILQELQEGGCIQEQGKLEIGIGRFPVLFGLNPKGGYFIGVDVKRSYINIGLIDLSGQISHEDYGIPYSLENTPEALEVICEEILLFIERHELKQRDILNINVNIPGRINPVTGHSYNLFNFFPDRPLASILSERIGTRVSIDNDTRGMAFGEFTQGCAKDLGVNSALYVNVSWGLGLGLILDGQIYFGKSGFSGELGHISVYNNQILCHCGKKGCLETEVSGQAMCRKVQARIRGGENSVLSPAVLRGEDLKMSDLIRACAQEDMLCLEVLSEMGLQLGKQIANLINVFNPELVIVGGSLADSNGFLTQHIEASVRTYSMSVVTKDTRIETATLGDKAGLIGACMLARTRRFEERSK
mgnify:FL=1